MKTDLTWKSKVNTVDSRRDIVILQDSDETVRFCVRHFISLANEAIKDHGFFYVALSGGSTPKVIFQQMSKPEFKHEVDWSKVMLFWSDERCVPPTSLDSNYRMAMDSGFSSLPVLPEHIFRIKGEIEPAKAAEDYNHLIEEAVPDHQFDLVMLGMGPDGHTASLFPGTSGLEAGNRLVIANYIPQKETWRLTFTLSLINHAKNIAFYTMGEGKAEMLKRVLDKEESPPLPAQRVGTHQHKALWIVDSAAAALLEK
jgi:6-phosphogluconolactonase